jgi:TolB protein
MKWKHFTLFIGLIFLETWGTTAFSLISPLVPTTNKIAFTDENAEIYVIDEDGSNTNQLTHNSCRDFSPDWSPDGSQIAFASDCNGSFDIYTMDGDGKNKLRLTYNRGNELSPTWSPDGSQIAFVSIQDSKNAIYLLNISNKVLHKLADFEDIISDLTWSPDGLRFLFQMGSIENSEIYVMDSDGNNLLNLTNNENIPDGAPAWSPNNAQIAFHSYRDAHCGGIYLMEVDGTNINRISSLDSCEYEPAWSPDGLTIAFKSYRDATDDIYLMNLDGSNIRRLTIDALGFEPDWRPQLMQ